MDKETTNPERLETVEKVFVSFLFLHGLRKTPERIAMLKEIYAIESHFDVDELHFRLRNNGFRISRATIYNNLDLFLESGLIRKHQFGKGMAQYEESYFFDQHDHIILTDTGEVREFCYPRIQNIKKTIEETFGIVVDSHSPYFYATHKHKP
ncbi:MAG: Fur family transcriptional regulator [Bacteroidota bacterium]